MHAKNQRNTVIRRKDQSIQKDSEIKQMKELAHKYIKTILYIYPTCSKKQKEYDHVKERHGRYLERSK